MSVTRAQIEAALIQRAGKSMTFVGFDGATVNGTNANLNEPIVNALMQMGKVAEYLTNVSDADLVGLTASEIVELLDVAELRLLRNIHGNINVVDTTSDSQTERYSQFADKILKAIERLEKKVSSEYGIGTPPLVAGKIRYDFIAKVP